MNVKVKYLLPEKSGLLLYYRAIPEDLRKHYGGKKLRKVSLKTHDTTLAAIKIKSLAAADDILWAKLRDPDPETAFINQLQMPIGKPTLDEAALRQAGKEAGALWKWHRLNEALNPEPVEVEKPKAAKHLFSHALEQYRKKHKDKANDKKWQADTNRSFNIAKDILGDLPLEDIHLKEAQEVLDFMLAQGWKTSTVRKYFSTLSAIFNRGLRIFELQLKNPFAAPEIPLLLTSSFRAELELGRSWRG